MTLHIRPDAVNIVAPLIRGGYHSRPIRVGVKSPLPHRRAVFKLAQYFRREFRYDFTQYGYDGKEADPDHAAFLWVHPDAAQSWPDFRVPCVGACCFRLRDEGYGLQWAWMHPYFRRRGLLSAAWPGFQKEFGVFDVEGPLSDAMAAFLRARGGAPV